MADFGKNYPVDGMVGAILRTLALGANALLLGTYASYIASTEGISFAFDRYRAWVFFIPAFTAACSGLFALRATYWVVAGITAGDKQLMVWRRNLLMELLFTGLGGFCLLLGNIPGMAWDLGPLGMIIVITGLGFLGNPQAILIDGASRRFVESGFFYASVIPFGPATLGPLCIISRPSGFESWHLGLGAMALSPAISREEAHRVAAYARERTGFGPPRGEDAQFMKRALEVLGEGLAQAKAIEGLRPRAVDPVAQFLALEPSLRALHGPGSLYVKPMVWTAGGRSLAAGGWAFLDGEPAILPTSLDLLTITSTSPSGAVDTVGRDPAAILAVLGARVERHEQPCPHVTVRVSEADKSELLAQIAALPDHRPGAATSSPAPRPVSAPPAAATPEGHVHPRQHRLLQPSVTFQAVNDAMYAAGFKSVLPISELEPDAAIYERATTPTSYKTPRITYAVDAKLGAKRLAIEWLAPRDVPSLPTLDAEAIDLSPTLPTDVLGRNLAQLTWLTASAPGWSGLAGAVETLRPHPSPLAPMKWESPRQTPEMICYSDPSPISLERVAALKNVTDPSVASAALNLEQQWLAQRAMNHR